MGTCVIEYPRGAPRSSGWWGKYRRQNQKGTSGALQAHYPCQASAWARMLNGRQHHGVVCPSGVVVVAVSLHLYLGHTLSIDYKPQSVSIYG